MRPRNALRTRRTIPVVAALWVCLPPGGVVGQDGPKMAAYDVEFSTLGSLLDPTCTATGTDVLTGTLVGPETPLPEEPSVYVGTLTRTTRISICGSRTTASGSEVVCSIDITGSGPANVKLTIEEGQRDGWLQYEDDLAPWAQWLPPPIPRPISSTVTGTCDPEEMAWLQSEYDSGETAGSPNGQPIEVPELPPPAYPHTFQANPPISIWTLQVQNRRW